MVFPLFPNKLSQRERERESWIIRGASPILNIFEGHLLFWTFTHHTSAQTVLEWWDSNYEKSMTPNPLLRVTGKYENMKHHWTSHWENDKKVWWRTYNLRISVIKTALSRDLSPGFNSPLPSSMIIDSGFKSNKECFLTPPPPPPSYNSLIPLAGTGRRRLGMKLSAGDQNMKISWALSAVVA